MTAVVDARLCVGCGYCVDICPVAGITLNEAMAATVDPERCIACGACEYDCPALAITLGTGSPIETSRAQV